MGYSASMVWAAPVLSRNFGLSADRAGSIMAMVLLISGVLGPLLGGTLADLSQRVGGPRRTISLMIGLAILQVPAGFFAVMPNVMWVSMLLVMLSMSCFMKGIICATVSTLVIPNELLGMCFGAQNALGALFGSLSPVIVSQLSNRTDWPANIGSALTLVCVATSVLGAIMFAFGRKHFHNGAG
jgi:MFS family permease